MPDIADVVEFLRSHQSLAMDESPWPTFDHSGHEYQRFRINWNALFPGGERRAAWRLREEEVAGLLEPIGPGWIGERPDEREAREMAEAQSWDVCAWYQPIHFFGLNWGIYIREDCVRRSFRDLAPFLPFGTSRTPQLADQLLRAAVYLYFLHEHYHHKVECLGLRLHVVEGRSSYRPYMARVYLPSRGTDDLLEEALANADVFRRLGDEPYRSWIGKIVVDAAREYLRATLPYDPPGYRRAVDYLREGAFEAGEDLLQGQVHEGTLAPLQPPSEWAIATRMMQSMFRVTDNIYTIVPSGTCSILPVFP